MLLVCKMGKVLHIDTFETKVTHFLLYAVIIYFFVGNALLNFVVKSILTHL